MKTNNKKKYILAIDTTSRISGAAIACNDTILAESNIDNGLNHSITLFNNIDFLLKKTKLKMSDIKEIKVANGPGSFTGIRIGIAAAIGLSKPYNTKITYVDSLNSLAYNVKENADYIISMIDAKVDRVYIAIYKKSNLKQILNDMIIDIDTLCTNLNKYFTNKNVCFIFVGDGAKNYSKNLKSSLKINFKIAKDKEIYQSASSLIFSSGKDSTTPKINYMLASKAEREREKCKR